MKKALKVILVFLLSVILLIGGLIGLLHLKSVQTYIIGKVAEKISEEFNIDVHIGQFYYEPLSDLTIDEIYISDQQKDTLAYFEQIYLNFELLKLEENLLEIELLTIKRPYLNLYTLSDDKLNCQFLLDVLKRDSGDFPLKVSINQLFLEQTRIRYNEILVDQLDLALTMPMMSKDSVDYYVNSLHLRAQTSKINATFEADIHGKLDSIYAENMVLTYKHNPIFKGNLAVFHPTSLDSLFINAHCNYLYCDSMIVMNALSDLNLKRIQLPSPIINLQSIEYTGDIKGNLGNLQLNGSFKTPLGSMSVDGNMKTDKTLQNFDIHGKFSTQQFQLGQMLDQKHLGKITFDAQIDATIDNAKLTSGEAQTKIHSIDYLGYCYNNVTLNGKWRSNEISGNLSIYDENIKVKVKGLADWDDKDTRFDFKIQVDDIAPYALHLTQKNPDFRFGATTYINFYTSGSKDLMFENMNGYVIFDSIRLKNKDNQYLIRQIKMLADSETNTDRPSHRLRIQSELITSSIYGHFSYKTLPTAIHHLVYEHLPYFVDKPSKPYPENTQVDFYAYPRNIDELNTVLDLNFGIPSLPTIKGHIYGRDFVLNASIPELEAKNFRFEDITLAVDNADNHLNVSLYAITHLPQHNPTVAKLGDISTTLNLSAANDSLDIDILLGNTDLVRNGGKISISSKIDNYLDKPKFDIQIKPTNFTLNDSIWSISPAQITYTHALKSIDIDNLTLNTDYQSITSSGRISTERNDSLNVQLNNINIDYLLSYTDANKVISIQGPVTGSATLYSVLSEMMLNAKATMPNGGINGIYLGDVTAEAHWDKTSKAIMIDGNVVDSTNHLVADITGEVVPSKKLWILDIDCDSIDIGFIDRWTNGIISNPSGRAFGKVRVRGENRQVNVTGSALAKNAQVTVPQIGVTYKFNDSIHLDSTSIRFPNIDVYDQYNNHGTFKGHVYHNNFMNIRYDLYAKANKMLVMDLPADQQSFFYGKVYGSGDVHIHGDEEDCYIDVNARTEANTKFYLNVYSASKATKSNFIDFVQPDTTTYGLLNLLSHTPSTNNSTQESRLKLTMAGEVTPQAEINLILEGDDVIKGKGEGNLKLTYEYPSENVQMQGSYMLHSGLFSFSLGNIIRRNFTIREGSKITWESDPMSPTVDITGHYHTTASLRDLFGSESAQIATNRTSVPVNCVLHMTDQLFNPVLSFAIELPQSDESVQSQVKSMINTDEMLMRQMIYLLVFNRFYTPDYLQNSNNVGLNETYSLLSSTVTGQINSWLSKLTDVFTMGFNFRTDGEGETASQEYEANFQINPINQLIINGNFGYRYNDLSNRPFFGDLDVEYLLTDNGKLRIKAYTHTVDKYSLRQANMVQGVGLVFKHDFNWKKNKHKKKKNAVSDSSQEDSDTTSDNNNNNTIEETYAD